MAFNGGSGGDVRWHQHRSTVFDGAGDEPRQGDGEAKMAGTMRG